MKSIERYVFWASLLSLVVFAAGFLGLFSLINFDHEYSSRVSGRFTSLSVQFLFSLLPNIAVAFWLAWAATKNRLKKLPWVTLAIAHGIYGAMLFYVLLGYFELKVLLTRQENET